MSTTGGGLKATGAQWLVNAAASGLSSLDFLKQRAGGSRPGEQAWVNFYFPPLAGPLSSNPTWIPNWVPLQVALQMPSIKRVCAQFNKGSNYANRTWFTTLAQAEAQGNRVWAKFRQGTNPGYPSLGGRIVVQLKMVPGYYEPLALNRD